MHVLLDLQPCGPALFVCPERARRTMGRPDQAVPIPVRA
jgi:hypothetical protein